MPSSGGCLLQPWWLNTTAAVMLLIAFGFIFRFQCGIVFDRWLRGATAAAVDWFERRLFGGRNAE